MSFSLQKLVLLVSLSATVTCHMIMKTPAPFSKVPPDNSPLSSSGANYPCKYDGSADYYETSNRTSMAIGESQTLSFTGSAVHGGGSCQIAVTSDKAPTPSTSWQVILSIEGGCPSITGDGPSTYDFEIPEGIATGDATLAWTWISKLAGQPEYYMNCAPITITGGSKKRSTDLEARATFPELFVANLASINDCKAGPSVDVIYPDPGSNIMYPKPASAMANGTATGSNCVPKGATGNAGSGSGSSAGSTSVAALTSSVYSSMVASSTTSVVSAPAKSSTLYINSNSGSATSAAAVSSTTSQSLTFVTLTMPTLHSSTSSALSVSSAPVVSATSAAASSTSSSATSPSGTSSAAGQLSGACTPEGEWNCLIASGGGFQYQRCASGSWTGMTVLPAGETCQLGLSMTLWRREEEEVKSVAGRIRMVHSHHKGKHGKAKSA